MLFCGRSFLLCHPYLWDTWLSTRCGCTVCWSGFLDGICCLPPMARLFLAATWLRCCEWHGFWFQGLSNAVLLHSKWNVLSTVTPENFEVPNALSLSVSAVQLPSQFYNGFAHTMYLNTRPSCRFVPQYVTSSRRANSFLPPICLCVLGERLQCCFTAPELGRMAAAVRIMEMITFLSNSTWFVSIPYSNEVP